MSDIEMPQDFCSQTTNKEIAEYFSYKYGLVLTKESTRYPVDMIMKLGISESV